MTRIDKQKNGGSRNLTFKGHSSDFYNFNDKILHVTISSMFLNIMPWYFVVLNAAFIHHWYTNNKIKLSKLVHIQRGFHTWKCIKTIMRFWKEPFRHNQLKSNFLGLIICKSLICVLWLCGVYQDNRDTGKNKCYNFY